MQQQTHFFCWCEMNSVPKWEKCGTWYVLQLQQQFSIHTSVRLRSIYVILFSLFLFLAFLRCGFYFPRLFFLSLSLTSSFFSSIFQFRQIVFCNKSAHILCVRVSITCFFLSPLVLTMLRCAVDVAVYVSIRYLFRANIFLHRAFR